VSLQQVHSGRDTIAVAAKEFHLHQAASVELRPLHQLPSVPPAFTGRELELRDLETALAKQGNIGAAISASGAGIQGMGGVGKTALATKLAHQFKDKYPDAQICLNLRGFDPMGRKPMPPVEAMQSIIHAFQPELKLPETAEELSPIYNSVLNEAGRVLLFLDNAANVEQIQPLLPPSNCLLLITSRNQFSLPGLATRNIDCLPPEKSRELLLKLAPRLKGHEATAANLCGHLPLALDVFAGAINNKSLTSVPELLERLRTRQEKLDAVDAAFQVSYELLGDELQKRWRLLAVFSASFDLPAAAAVWDEGPGRDALPRVQAGRQVGPTDSLNSARNAMQMLVNASLVERNETTQRFRLHDLVRQFCNGKLSDAERDAAMMRYARHYTKAGRQAQQLYRKGAENVLRGLDLFDRERIHIEAAYEWLEPKHDEASAALLIELVDAVVDTGQALRFHPSQRIRWSEGQRDAARITKNRQMECLALGNLGNAYAHMGEQGKAIEFYEQVLVIYRETGNRRGEGATLANLGLAYFNLGEPRKAIELYERALVIAREIVNRRVEGKALGNLGNAYAHLGEPRKAIELFEQARVISREIGDRHDEGNILCCLGIAFTDLGEPLKAIEFLEQQMVIAREIRDKRGEGDALNNIGIVYAGFGELRKAVDSFDQARMIAREIGDWSGEGSRLFNSALALEKLGDRAQAIACAEAALQIFEAIEHPAAATVRAQLEKWKGDRGK
jgi:tetratricopeptide (TPR) repeat protein